jgi:hypothetical protein
MTASFQILFILSIIHSSSLHLTLYSLKLPKELSLNKLQIIHNECTSYKVKGYNVWLSEAALCLSRKSTVLVFVYRELRKQNS